MRALIYNVMLISLQLPFTDLRNFSEDDHGLLGRPNWPLGVPQKDFVRSFGIISKRPRGGMPGWIGENFICNAKRAIRFQDPLIYPSKNEKKKLAFRVAFRRLFFDGLATGKLSIGLSSLNSVESLSSVDVKNLFFEFLNTQVKVPSGKDNLKTIPLRNAGKLVSNLYEISSVETNYIEYQNERLIKPIKPLIIFIYNKDEVLCMPFPGDDLPLNLKGFKLSNYLVDIMGQSLNLWAIEIHSDLNERHGLIRSLRICLSRLHAEYSSLINVLQAIGSGKLEITPRSEASQMLQLYLNRAIDIISKNEEALNQFGEKDAIELANKAIDITEPGYRDELLRSIEKVDIQLKKYDVRLNIRRKVSEFINSNINIKQGGVLIMGDNYENKGQVGAFGRNASAENFTQNWKNISDEINIDELSNELSKLREELKKRSSKPEEDIETGNIAKAEIEAKKGNGEKMLEYLSKSSKWALDVATEIGLKLATEILKKHTGIG